MYRMVDGKLQEVIEENEHPNQSEEVEIGVPITNVICSDTRSKDWNLIVDSIDRNGVPLEIYTWPFVTPKFCDEIIGYAEDYGRWSTGRHEHYPTHDILLKVFGWDDMYNTLLNEFAHPIVRDIWGLEGKRWNEMNCENFIVKYDNESEDHQSFLNLHHDASDYTLILTLNDGYEGGGTWFPNQKYLLKNEVGYITTHPTYTHKHGARSVTDGIRYVIISFCNQGKG